MGREEKKIRINQGKEEKGKSRFQASLDVFSLIFSKSQEGMQMIAFPFLSLIFTLDKEKEKGKIMTKGGGGKEGAEKET